MITKEKAIVYKLRNIEGGLWADVTIREWNKGGSFSCQSDYGDFFHIWRNVGDRTLRDFLCSLDKQYFMKKTKNYKHMEFSFNKSIKQIKTDILKARRNREIGYQKALECWEEVEELNFESGSTEHEYANYLENHCPVLMRVYADGDIGGYEGYPPLKEEYAWGCDGFWDLLWPHFVEYWKKELGEEKYND